MKRIFIPIIVLIFYGQISAARITGEVLDKNNKPVAAALIEILELNVQTMSNDEGHFYFAFIPPGKFTLLAYKKILAMVK